MELTIEKEEIPSPEEAWGKTKEKLIKASPMKWAWLLTGSLEKFHEGLFIVKFPYVSLLMAQKMPHEMLVLLNKSINRHLTRLMKEPCEIKALWGDQPPTQIDHLIG